MFRSIFFLAFFAYAVFCFKFDKHETSDWCSSCEVLLGFVEAFIKNNSTETEALKFIESACSALPEPYSSAVCFRLNIFF